MAKPSSNIKRVSTLPMIRPAISMDSMVPRPDGAVTSPVVATG